MTNVQVAIRLRRKTGKDALVFSVFEVLFNDLFNKIQAFFVAHIIRLLSCKNKVNRSFGKPLKH